MMLGQKPTKASVATPVALERALEQNVDAKAKVEEAAGDLALANESVKKQIAEGATSVSAHQALANTEKVESKVQECVADLQEVNETLSQGIDNLKRTEIALTKTRKALADTEVALATAQEEEKKANLRALHDSTTGLPNRDLFDDRLAHAISLAERHNWTLAVMFFDLDRFKNINDSHGHAAGDRVLKEVAKRLLHHARDEDTVCRYGGDEFLYLLVNPQGSENIERIACAILKNIALPIEMGDQQLVINTSIGIAIFPDNGATGEQLIRNADTAMYRAKERMSGFVFFGELNSERNSN